MLAFFERLIAPFPAAKPAKPPETLFRFMWHYARPIAPHLLLVCFTSTAFAVLEVALFGYLGSLVDFLADADPETFWADHFWWLLGAAAVMLVLLPVIALLNGLITNQSIMGNFPMRLRWLMHRYVLRQSMQFFQDDFAGRVATKVMQTALAVRDVLALATEVLVYVGVYFIASLILFADSHWAMIIPLSLWILTYAISMKYFIPKMQRVSKEQADARSDVTGRIVDSYTNIQTVKLFAHAAREESYAKESMTPFMETVHRSFRLVTGMDFVLQMQNGLLLFGTGVLGIWLWTEGAMTGGEVALTLGLVLRMKGMSHWVMFELAHLFENIGTVQDGMETIARKQVLVDSPAARPLSIDAGAIAFDAVTFHYGKESGVLENLSFEIKPGERVGLVGPSGAGKSTIVNLLLRFYDTESGCILIDGQDVSTVTQESLRKSIGLVSQDTSLLHRSIRDNIRYGRPDASGSEIEAAILAAKAEAFIPGLEDNLGRQGLDAHVGERGVKLSGGQRQRIAIARVILKDAPILVLDEATSALDSEVEAVIQESLTDLMAGKTVIAIAHRLSTIAAMDRLIVMDQGKIVEQGSHEDLLARNGLYARLWARQSGGFLDIGDGEKGHVGVSDAWRKGDPDLIDAME
ncbi:MAG: ABC transporter ATP-binding protein [Alphaproteobacteria bacterium]